VARKFRNPRGISKLGHETTSQTAERRKKKTSGPPPSETELTGTAPDNVEKLPQEKKLP
jgi:hypothetical protein